MPAVWNATSLSMWIYVLCFHTPNPRGIYLSKAPPLDIILSWILLSEFLNSLFMLKPPAPQDFTFIGLESLNTKKNLALEHLHI